MVSYSRTLSLGLRPFGVGVMVAMAGTVRSNMGKKKRGSLPRGGLYARVQGLYVARLGFSQKREARPMETGVLARGLVGEALKGEGGGWWWGRWVRGRRRDWWYCGGQSGLVYWGPVIGRVGDGLGGVEEVWAWGAGEDGG